jgi:branched-chain amino acid aminotransferase
VPASETLRAASDAVLAANELREGRLRITVTGGESPLGSERGDAEPTVIVAASELAPRADDATVVTVPWARNERSAVAGLKTISYAENVRALAYAREHGAIEAIFPNTRGDLCEATGSNVFLVFQNVLHTPPPDAGCLLGVTRALVLELAEQLDIPIEEAALPLDALHRADEAFLSSTTREVQAIAQVDGQKLAAVPGPITTRLAEAFTELIGRDLDP